MLISELMSRSDNFTDEQVTTSMAQSYVDEAISKINTELQLHLPFFDLETNYTALNDSWQMQLFLSYINYGVKLNDTSLTEANIYLMSFQNALSNLRGKLENSVAETYWGSDNGDGTYNLEGFGGAYQIDTSNAIPNPSWFTGSGEEIW